MKIISHLKNRYKNKRNILTDCLLAVGVLLLPYVLISCLIAWWFYKKSKFTKKTKITTSAVLGGLLVLLVGWGAVSYANDAEPHLTVDKPSSVVKASQVTLKGTYDPTDRKVWINGKQIPASNGRFETVYQLNEGENSIDISAGDWKRTHVTFTVKRELTDDERKARVTPPTATPKPKEKSSVASTATPIPTNVAPTKVPEKKKEVKQTPEQTFESICKKYGGTDNCIYDKDASGAWSVTQLIQAKEEFMLFSTSKQISRDFIFAVYATKLPIAHASITITMPGKYYRAGLGADMADTQSDSTWTSNDVGPSIFYDFLKSATNGSAGDGLNSTYVETNLN